MQKQHYPAIRCMQKRIASLQEDISDALKIKKTTAIPIEKCFANNTITNSTNEIKLLQNTINFLLKQ